MKTLFKSSQYNITGDQLSKFFQNIEGIKEIKLWNIKIMPSGHGHYTITSDWVVDGKEVNVKRKTSNMQLIDAWKSGMKDLYQSGEDGYDNWDGVVESMLYTIDLEKYL